MMDSFKKNDTLPEGAPAPADGSPDPDLRDGLTRLCEDLDKIFGVMDDPDDDGDGESRAPRRPASK